MKLFTIAVLATFMGYTHGYSSYLTIDDATDRTLLRRTSVPSRTSIPGSSEASKPSLRSGPSSEGGRDMRQARKKRREGYSSGDSDSSGDDADPNSLAKIKAAGIGPAYIQRGYHYEHSERIEAGQRFKTRVRDPVRTSMKIRLGDGGKAKMRSRGSKYVQSRVRDLGANAEGIITYNNRPNPYPAVVRPPGQAFRLEANGPDAPPLISQTKVNGQGVLGADVYNYVRD